ncbi:hypothetical protein V8B97DRAFT_823251 [Scleroderma yunnanense]
MIVTNMPTAERSKADTEDAGTTTCSHPPAYETLRQDDRLPRPACSTSISPEVAEDPLTKLNCKPTNFLYVDEKSCAIKETYVIDPLLHIPDAYLTPLNAQEERKNVYIHTRDGSIDVDLWIVGRKDAETSRSEKAPDPMRRTTIHVSSRDGSVFVKVYAIDNIHPFSLEIVSRDGRISAVIPRSFHGPLVLKSIHGNCVLSDGLLGNSTQLGSTVDHTRKWFVGDFSTVSASDPGLAEWAGDEVRAETKDGRVRVKYIGEVESVVSKRGFFGRLFYD